MGLLGALHLSASGLQEKAGQELEGRVGFLNAWWINAVSI